MRIFTLILINFVLMSCQDKLQQKSKIKDVEIKNIKLGPIVHDKLNDEQLQKIKYIQESFYEVLPVSLNETILNFKRDKNPNNEINIWFVMAKVYKAYADKYSSVNKLENRKEAFHLILMRSMMSEKEALGRSNLKLLTQVEIQFIFKNYVIEAKPIQLKYK
ncbi:MAG: hypothetical protein ACPGSD_01655 [Flavobacteriales bacterium]